MTSRLDSPEATGRTALDRPDGTVCILATCDDAAAITRYRSIRDAQVVRERRLYGRASAQIWRRDGRTVGYPQATRVRQIGGDRVSGLRNQFRRRHEPLHVPANDLLQHHVRVFLLDLVDREIVPPQ